MSCIRFTTPAQLRQLRALSPAMLTREEASALHPAPAVTESKLRRLRILAVDRNPRIRESVASGLHTPVDVMSALACDPEESVRACVARNAAVAPGVLRALADDASDTVRGWLVVNPSTPADIRQTLETDTSSTVMSLVAWHRGLVAV